MKGSRTARPSAMLGIAMVAGLAVASAVSPAQATLTFTLGTPNTAISPHAAPYGQAALTRNDATHATLTFSSFSGGTPSYWFLDGGSVAFNVNGAFSVTSITGNSLGSGHTPVYTDGGVANVSAFGTFSDTINTFDGFGYRSSVITVDIQATGGNSWANEGAVLTANSKGYTVAAHIGVCSTPTCSGGFVATGFAANGSGPPIDDGGNGIPEPAALGLFGAAMAGLGLVRRRRR